MHPLHLPGSFFLFIIITFVLTHAPKFASSVDERYANCNRTFACGNIENIGYPFWGSGRPDYCGFPGFQLNCRDSILEITIMSATYHVLGINNKARLLNVARADYLDDLCPAFLINTTLLNPELFEFTSDTQDINLYYHRLPLPPPPSPIPNQESEYFSHFTCNVNETTFDGYYLTRNLSDLPGLASFATAISDFLGRCGERVVLAANQSEIQSMEASPCPNGQNLAEALAKGFGLKWNANDSLCDRCRGSGGQCGYDTVLKKFSCYCTDRPHDTVCPTGSLAINPHGKKKIPLVTGLSIAGGVIAGILMGVWCLLWIQSRKRIVAQSQIKDVPATPPLGKGLGPTTPSTTHSESIPSYSSVKSDIEKGSTYFGVQVFSYR